MNDRQVINLLQSAEWPTPSQELRARIAATPLRPQTIAWSDRIWYSREWRIGIVVATVTLVAIDIWGGRATTLITPAGINIYAEAETRTIEDLIRSVGLPDNVAASIARRHMLVSHVAAADRASLISGEER